MGPEARIMEHHARVAMGRMHALPGRKGMALPYVRDSRMHTHTHTHGTAIAKEVTLSESGIDTLDAPRWGSLKRSHGSP